MISGGALGIDAAAHRGSLAADGATVAILANGVDVPYPASNEGLFAEMARRSLLVSESPPGTHPHRLRFLVRNRVIAALSRGTVIVEAEARSGALNTAGLGGQARPRRHGGARPDHVPVLGRLPPPPARGGHHAGDALRGDRRGGGAHRRRPGAATGHPRPPTRPPGAGHPLRPGGLPGARRDRPRPARGQGGRRPEHRQRQARPPGRRRLHRTHTSRLAPNKIRQIPHRSHPTPEQ
ncbi:DNA-processing protein DprA [Actinomadura madurae]|uniref:DNA-processing protein DprA n=1 Tax=Actinomadura madurae TaxID=1993 RepID=UPI0020D2547B|nr:DNA-processing protein DprA [Actinomadura madurae]MCP9954406.1 DNA-protecting protein DprA [Actinomadura madurae]MCP9983636.1 DNA-protecting protein DprA [Actinomadura madurae]